MRILLRIEGAAPLDEGLLSFHLLAVLADLQAVPRTEDASELMTESFPKPVQGNQVISLAGFLVETGPTIGAFRAVCGAEIGDVNEVDLGGFLL